MQGEEVAPQTNDCEAETWPGEWPDPAKAPTARSSQAASSVRPALAQLPAPATVAGRSPLNTNEQVHQSSVEDGERRLHLVLPAIARSRLAALPLPKTRSVYWS